jgi:hypothetical protein
VANTKRGAASFVGGRQCCSVIRWLTSGQYKKWRCQFCWWQGMRFCHMVAYKWPIQTVVRPVLLVTGNALQSYGGWEVGYTKVDVTMVKWLWRLSVIICSGSVEIVMHSRNVVL